MENDPERIEDAFYHSLLFGTGGLRGIIGVGTNCMNVHAMAKTSRGIANYLRAVGKTEPQIAVSCDSRLKSYLSAQTACSVFAANRIKVHLYHAGGCQITTEAADAILAQIEKVDEFDDVKWTVFAQSMASGRIAHISKDIYTAFVKAVKRSPSSSVKGLTRTFPSSISR